MAAKDRSQEILDAALAVFSRVGFHHARIEDIAERAGVAKGTVYIYFPGKQELFRALFERMTEAHLAKIAEALSGGGSLEERLVLVADHHLSLFMSQKDIDGLNIHELVVSDPELKKKMLSYRDRYALLLATALQGETIREEQEPEFFRDAAIAFIGLLHAFQHDRQQVNIKTLPQRLVSLFLRGLEGQNT